MSCLVNAGSLMFQEMDETTTGIINFQIGSALCGLVI